MKNLPTFFLSSYSQINTLTWWVPQRISGRLPSATTGSPNDSPGNCSKVTTAVVAQWILGQMHQTSWPGRPMNPRPCEWVTCSVTTCVAQWILGRLLQQRNDRIGSTQWILGSKLQRSNDRIESPNESSGQNCSRVTNDRPGRPMNLRENAAA